MRGLGVVLGKISGLMGLLLSPKKVDDMTKVFDLCVKVEKEYQVVGYCSRAI